MTDVAEHFFLLDTEARRASGSQLLTRAIGVETAGHEALVAIDSSRQKHLLVPVSTDEVTPDNTSQGVTLGARVLLVDGSEVVYADLHCHMSPLEGVFEKLVTDVLGRLAVDRSDPVAICRKVLDEWRALLKSSAQSVSRETVIGLIGELEVLRRLATAAPLKALDTWQGPSNSVHDFVRDGNELEVKTTTSVDGNFVSISNLDQLDPTLVTSLHLVVVHAREDPRARSLDERLDDLVAMGVPQSALLAKVASAGFLYGSGITSEDRYQVRSVRAWKVGKSFPGLRRSDLGEVRLRGISKIRYELALDSAPNRLPDAEFETFITNWVTGG